MKKIAHALAATVMACSVTTSFGGTAFETGNSLLKRLSGDPFVDRTFALAYIAGVADHADVTREVCAQPGVQANQLKEIVLKYLKNHPENRHHPAAELVVNALKGAFPC